MSSDLMTTRDAPRIRLLDPAVAERIAAGEVIERPASVVKELVENSLDAGATEIAVILEDGGKQLIEILDNGRGMAPDDLALSIKRHATSKLSTLQDLERISTLGFRGEALPSVAAASELSILSRTATELDGVGAAAWLLQASAPGQAAIAPERATHGHFLNSAHGTRVQARGLFSQIPARLKFLKSQASEVGNVREWLERIAIAHPHVGFKLVSGDRTVLNLRPSTGPNGEADRVSSVLADSTASDSGYPVVTRELELADMRIRAHWIQGLSTPQTRKLVQVVNGRALRDRMLQQAMLAAFRQALLPGQFPAAALLIEIDPRLIDVNVHPTKTEVRFLNSRDVFHHVDQLFAAMIERDGAPAYVPSPVVASGSHWPSPSFAAREPMVPPRILQSSLFPASSFNLEPSRPGSPVSTDAPDAHPGVPAIEPTTAYPLATARFAGILFNTYILHELPGDNGTADEAVLVDQHAAHERIRYERLRRRALDPARAPGTLAASQLLMIPEAARFDVELRTEVEARLPWLERLGFEVELFGDDTLLFRAIPSEWSGGDLRLRLKNLVDRLATAEVADQPMAEATGEAGRRALLIDERLFEKLASEACHSAIRAGDRLEDAEARALVRDLFACEHPWNCPHGRPTVVRMPRARFEEWFQRRV